MTARNPAGRVARVSGERVPDIPPNARDSQGQSADWEDQLPAQGTPGERDSPGKQDEKGHLGRLDHILLLRLLEPAPSDAPHQTSR